MVPDALNSLVSLKLLDVRHLGQPIVCELGPSKCCCLHMESNTENTVIRVCDLFVQEIRVAEVRDLSSRIPWPTFSFLFIFCFFFLQPFLFYNFFIHVVYLQHHGLLPSIEKKISRLFFFSALHINDTSGEVSCEMHQVGLTSAPLYLHTDYPGQCDVMSLQIFIVVSTILPFTCF